MTYIDAVCERIGDGADPAMIMRLDCPYEYFYTSALDECPADGEELQTMTEFHKCCVGCWTREIPGSDTRIEKMIRSIRLALRMRTGDGKI